MQTEGSRRRVIEDALARPMFFLAVAFLMLVAALTRIAPQVLHGKDMPGAIWMLGALAALWPIFLLEGMIRFFLRPRAGWSGRYALYCAVTGVLPPLRLATRSATRANHVWLPRLGWSEMNFDLQKSLEHIFGAPMFFMALLILPILAIHYFLAAQVEAHPFLRFLLDFSNALIWLAFTMEFVIRVSVAERKLAYAFTHWVDLAVVVLPTLEFMPFLRVLRLTQVARLKAIVPVLNYYVNYYRIYGVAGKGWRALVLLKMFSRMFNRSKEAELNRLRSQLAARESQAREVEREIDYYRRKIAELEALMPPKPAPSAVLDAAPAPIAPDAE